MAGTPSRCLLAVLIWTASLLGFTYSVVYTSSVKIKDMVEQEEQILNLLHAEISKLGNETAALCFSKFFHERMLTVRERKNDAQLQLYLKHPNGIYHSIKQFASDYENIRSALVSASPTVRKYLSSIADKSDARGAKLSVLRLQTVYNLKPSDMINGNYLGFVGPELSDVDALEIGEVAFTEGWLNPAIEWFQEALAKTKARMPSVGFLNNEDDPDLTGRIYALLGRSYVRLGDQEKANEMFRKAQNYDPMNNHVLELEKELSSKPNLPVPYQIDSNFTRLCRLQSKLTQDKFDRRLKCTYRAAILPYFRFKMELLSVAPYVALFYDVITDAEINFITQTSRVHLERGQIQEFGKTEPQELRTSDTTFVDDSSSPIVARLSQRVTAATSLSTTPYVVGKDYSAEPFQVVNYGLGGHYESHTDTFDEASIKSAGMEMYHNFGGNRLATYLIYLTEVEHGGSTVFTKVDIAVKPVKKMALFWYNYKPSGELDELTRHAGCPVAIGHKWVTNKWIWQYGNTFTRRCGLTPDATQLDIDKYMRRKWM